MRRTTKHSRCLSRLTILIRGAALVVATALSVVVLAQSRPDPLTQRVNERIRALQKEAEQLAAQSRTLLGDLRQLEIERDLRTEEAKQAEAAAAAAQQALVATSDRITTLEQQRDAQLPDIRAQLVDIYKRGRSGYAQLLFGASSVRDLARATRAVASLSTVNQRRFEEHRATLTSLRTERASLEQHTRELRITQEEAERARTAAQRAIAARTALIAQIDSRRDLAAQYAGELQVAYNRLQQQLTSPVPGRVDVPLAPFRGALDWPVTGRIAARFGQTERPGGQAVRNGIDIVAPENTPVRAVHGGTIASAGPFSGFGNLVILDHGGNNFTLYGDLSSLAVTRGDVVEAGAELGRTGQGPGTATGLYFEVRIDGRPVDPLQWLKPR